MGGTAFIAASMYVHVHVSVSGEGECVCVCGGGCDCVGVGVIAWVRKGVCGGTVLIAAVMYVCWG